MCVNCLIMHTTTNELYIRVLFLYRKSPSVEFNWPHCVINIKQQYSAQSPTHPSKDYSWWWLDTRWNICRKYDWSTYIVIYTNVLKHIACKIGKDTLKQISYAYKKRSIWEPAVGSLWGISFMFFLVKGVFITMIEKKKKKKIAVNPFPQNKQ